MFERNLVPAIAAGKVTPLLLAAASLGLMLGGCKSGAPVVDDATLTKNIQTALTGDNSIAGQPVQAVVAGGVATLGGSVQNDAQRTIAARDAAGVNGVKEVVNNIVVNTPPPATASVEVPPPAPVPVATKKTTAVLRPMPEPPHHEPAPIERPQQAYNPPPPPPQPPPSAPPPPPQPTFKTVTIAAGESIPVRVTQTLDSATTQEGASFSGVVASDVLVGGLVAIPAGSPVSGRVDAVHEAGHFKGESLLTVSLTGISRRGDLLQVGSDPYSVEGKGRGKNTVEKTAGGAAVGAILGGIFGGGKGAAIGAAAGGGVGAGSNAVTRGQQVQIASESIVRFHLSSPVTVRVRTDGGDRNDGEQRLQPR